MKIFSAENSDPKLYSDIIKDCFCTLVSPVQKTGDFFFQVRFEIKIMIGGKKVWGKTTKPYHVVDLKLHEVNYNMPAYSKNKIFVLKLPTSD